jgi:hypothetical protein
LAFFSSCNDLRLFLWARGYWLFLHVSRLNLWFGLYFLKFLLLFLLLLLYLDLRTALFLLLVIVIILVGVNVRDHIVCYVVGGSHWREV